MGPEQLVDDLNPGSGAGEPGQAAATTAEYLRHPRSGLTTPVHLDTVEVPFQQSMANLHEPEPSRWDLSRLTSRIGVGPIVAVALTVVLIALFASFITGNARSLGDDDTALSDQAGSFGAVPAVAGNDTDSSQGDAPTGPVVVGSGEDAPADQGSDSASGRSTGSVNSTGGGGSGPGGLVEPDSVLTSDNGGWVTTTTAAPTTAPTTASTAPSTETTAPTTASTASTTAPTTASTTAPETTAAPAGLSVRPVGPGSGDGENPQIVSRRNVTLQAEASGGNDVEYRFRVYLWVFGGWRQVDRSSWRSDNTWTIDPGRYDGRTVRWTVTARDGDTRERTPESGPLFIRSDG